MIYCRVDGNAVSHACHPSLHGCRLLLCQPISGAGEATGDPIVAIDHFGAGLHSKVFVSTDGIGCRDIVHDPASPVRNFVQGIIDN